MYSKDPDEQKRANANYKKLRTERVKLKQKRNAQIRELIDMASQSWTEAERAGYLTQIDLSGEWIGTGKWDCDYTTSGAAVVFAIGYCGL